MKKILIALISLALLTLVNCKDEEPKPFPTGNCIFYPEGAFNIDQQNFATIRSTTHILAGTDLEDLLPLKNPDVFYNVPEDTVSYQFTNLQLLLSEGQTLDIPTTDDGFFTGTSEWLTTNGINELPGISFKAAINGVEQEFTISSEDVFGDDISSKGFFYYQIGILDFENGIGFAKTTFTNDFVTLCEATRL